MASDGVTKVSLHITMKPSGESTGKRPPAPRPKSSAWVPPTVKVLKTWPFTDEKAADGWPVDQGPPKLPTSFEMLWGPIFGPGGTGLATLTDADTFVELGCGKGGVLLAAHRSAPKCRVVGIDFDPAIADSARQLIAAEVPSTDGVRPPIEVICGNIDDCFEDVQESPGSSGSVFKISDATLVFAFLLPWSLARIRPKLLHALPIGARILCRRFTMGKCWPPDAECRDNDGDVYRLYIVTARAKEDPILLSTADLEEDFADIKEAFATDTW